MRLLLVRHGDAEDYAESDCSRRLTAKGQKQAAAAGRFLRTRGFRPAEIICSPYTRARETAAGILAELPAEWDLQIRTVSRLGCGCTGGDMREILSAGRRDGDILAVGHQPDCGGILEYFIGGGQFAFKKCTMAVIQLYEIRANAGELLAFVPADLQD